MKRVKRLPQVAPQVMLTSMIDIFTILLIFMLKSYTAIDLAPSKQLTLAKSDAERTPEMALKITVAKDAIAVDDKPVAPIKDGVVHSALKKNLLIVPLFDALEHHASRRAAVLQAYPDLAKKFQERVLIVGDEDTPAALIDEVFYTIGQRGFQHFHLVVERRPAKKAS